MAGEAAGDKQRSPISSINDRSLHNKYLSPFILVGTPRITLRN
jgi:hypothetical protein